MDLVLSPVIKITALEKLSFRVTAFSTRHRGRRPDCICVSERQYDEYLKLLNNPNVRERGAYYNGIPLKISK